MALSVHKLRKHGVLAVLLLLCPVFSFAQKRISADVEVKTLIGKNVVTNHRSLYCSSNGRMVITSRNPVEYVMITNLNKETSVFFPGTNEVIVDKSSMSGARDELLSLFLFGRLEDLGVGLSGYRLVSTEMQEDGLVKKDFTSSDKNMPPYCEIVYRDYLPIYSATLDADRNYLTKVYYSQYKEVGWMPFPHRNTRITYTSKKDSTIVRTIYSNIVIDGDDPMFEFTVPADAKPMDLNNKKIK